jgi:Rha family phage regulatory protein
MKQDIIPAQAEPLVTLHEGKLVTNTIIIAEKFDKPHSDVLKTVRTVVDDCPAQFGEGNFSLTSYYDNQGKQRPMYELTEKAFALVAMGFNGERFMAWKIAFLEEFERRGRELHARETALTQAARVELLKANPLWKAIARYKGLGLNQVEIARLTGHGKEAIRKHTRRMEACGVLQPPPNLARMQQLALPLTMNGVKHVH